AQTTDISSGRFPNGIGPFIKMSPTFSATNKGGISGIPESAGKMVKHFFLSQNYPNPFNPSTTISFSLLKESNVSLKVFNMLGEQIQTLVEEKLPVGEFQYQWRAHNLPNGVYFYSLKVGSSFSKTKKMLLLK
ncbi:MAG: T9SS type A sorting domain-containing protein, partial [Bacteroidales bacterium]|nr:T9SS type A sorting domain-containing protein [Bacteroidales bacterium]